MLITLAILLYRVLRRTIKVQRETINGDISRTYLVHCKLSSQLIQKSTARFKFTISTSMVCAKTHTCSMQDYSLTKLD